MHWWARRLCAATFLAAIAAAPSGAQSASTRDLSERVSNDTARMLAAYKERSAAQKAEGRRSNIKAYIGEDGVPHLASQNSPNRKLENYREVTFEQIRVDASYRNRAINSYGMDEFKTLAAKYAQHYNVDHHLVLAVMKAESNFNPKATSSAGAKGLMQLMPGTAKDMGVARIFDPAENIAGGTQYLAKMLEMFNGDVTHALAGYNAGPANVTKYGGVPPFDETKNYIKHVNKWYKQFSGGDLSGLRVAQSTPRLYANLQPREKTLYTVKFKSGYIQSATSVEEGQDGYYVLHFKGKAYPVRKNLVDEIIEPS